VLTTIDLTIGNDRSHHMQKLIVTTIFVFIALAGIPAVFAQPDPGSRPSTVPEGVPPAPVGHFQPTAKTVPASAYNDARDKLDKDNAKENAILDRKMKNICRGC
jgi:hypothetical protein